MARTSSASFLVIRSITRMKLQAVPRAHFLVSRHDGWRLMTWEWKAAVSTRQRKTKKPTQAGHL
jgi:hypothetical protein